MNTYYSSNNLSYVDWTSVPMLAQKGRNFPTFVIRVGPRDRRTGLSGGNTRAACARYSTLTYDTSIV